MEHDRRISYTKTEEPKKIAAFNFFLLLGDSTPFLG